MLAAYALIIALSAAGVRLSAFAVKLGVGGGAFLIARKHLKDHPADAYALAVGKVVRMQVVLMALIELATLGMVFVLPAGAFGVVGLGVLLLGAIVHCAIAVWATLRLNALARSQATV
jgi:hypothetical protein